MTFLAWWRLFWIVCSIGSGLLYGYAVAWWCGLGFALAGILVLVPALPSDRR